MAMYVSSTTDPLVRVAQQHMLDMQAAAERSRRVRQARKGRHETATATRTTEQR